MSRPIVQTFFHKDTFTAQYVVSCPETLKCAILDSVLDYDAPSGRTSEKAIEEICNYVATNKLVPQWILDTHVHADHLTGMAALKKRFPGATTGIGSHVVDVIETFSKIFEDDTFGRDGSQFDRLFADNDTFQVGNLSASVLHTPGHTPADLTFVIGDCAFCGDSIFMPDSGTARCDFPGGSAATLYSSITRKIFALPDTTRLYVGHDYGADGKRDVAWQTTISEEKTTNKHVSVNSKEGSFIEMRYTRDRELGMPRLIIPSLQVNLRAGRFPEATPSGKVFLKLPLNVF